jgi:hypothetical protein
MAKLTEAQILLRMRNGEEFELEDNVDETTDINISESSDGKALRDAMDDIENARMACRELAKNYVNPVWNTIISDLSKILIDMRKAGVKANVV